MKQEAIEAALSASAPTAMYGGSGAMIVGGVLASDIAIIAGAVVGVAGFLVNWYYKHMQNGRRQMEHELRMHAGGFPEADTET